MNISQKVFDNTSAIRLCKRGDRLLNTAGSKRQLTKNYWIQGQVFFVTKTEESFHFSDTFFERELFFQFDSY
jgi:hypothetical protein